MTSTAILAGLQASIADLSWRDVALGVVIFAGTLALNLVLVGVIVLKMPPTYLLDGHAHRRGIAKMIALNLLGLLLFALGIVMSLPGVPGQGLLTIVIGILLMDMPGKRRLARLVLGRYGMLDRLNRFRRRFGMEALLTTLDARPRAPVRGAR